MRRKLVTRGLGCSALALMVVESAFNAIFAVTLNDIQPAIQLLAFVAFAVNILVIATLVFFVTYYTAKIDQQPIGMREHLCWRFVTLAVSVSVISIPLSLISLVALARDPEHLPARIVNQPRKAVTVAWLVVWVVSILLRAAFLGFLVFWTKQALKACPGGQQSLDIGFGIDRPEMVEGRPDTRNTLGSFRSQDNTLVTPPRTPTTPRLKSSFASSSTRVGPGSSRTRLIAGSAKSSLDGFPAGEATNIDNAFDRWDTSSVHHEVRATLHSSPPVTRSGLETIPGSRPGSPAGALDGPFLPSTPHAPNSDSATAFGWMPGSPREASFSSPPASPPNFSRPASRQRKPSSPAPPPNLMEELVHPLFRRSSPNPSPLAAPGTMITASPMAGQPISPRTLYRVRSATLPNQSTASLPAKPQRDECSPVGSPGPSIVEDDELPPILPGFVLSAGQRSSLIGYGRRKSVKDRT